MEISKLRLVKDQGDNIRGVSSSGSGGDNDDEEVLLDLYQMSPESDRVGGII